MINFLAEISIEQEYSWPTPSTKHSRQHNIYEIDINARPKDTYWTDWGGTYDNYSHYNIELYYTKFLDRKDTVQEVLDNDYSFIVTGRTVYFNIPKHPWLYPDYSVSHRKVHAFLHSALNPDKPSFNLIDGSNAPVRLELPDVNIKLSDNFNGITLNQGFSITLINNDGYFDSDEEWNLFNSPVRLKKSAKEISEYADFKNIRNGFIDTVVTGFDSFQITVGDQLKSLTNPACETVSAERYPGLDIGSMIGKNIPVVYGRKRIKLHKLDETRYLVIAEHITSVVHVFDKEGNELLHGSQWSYDSESKIITAGLETGGNGQPTNKPLTAEAAEIFGYVEHPAYGLCGLGKIIKDLAVRKGKIDFGPTNWNIEEAETYINDSPNANIIIESGDVKGAIDSALKNDMAYFFQQPDGRLTIRKYGRQYNTHVIPAEMLTQKPEKDYGKAQENYFSSCRINYDYTDKETYKTFLYKDREKEAEDKYNRLVTKTFDTDLYGENEARDFAVLLSNRYTNLKQTVKIAVGADTSGMNLLDTVKIDLNINERSFSKVSNFIIKEINPAQDKLVLEEI